VVVVGCSFFTDLSELSGGSDATSTDGGDAAWSIDAGCLDGSVVVALNGTAFCIDAHEVTVSEYEAFLTAKMGDTSGQPSYCAFNTTFQPSTWPQANPSRPVVAVDQCDAIAYCAWAGERLCGAVDGGHADPDNLTDPGGQWYFACSHSGDGVHLYPYGLDYDGSACNGADFWGDAGPHATDVESSPGCVGGFAGIFDMSGNVYEWEDSCHSYDGGDDKCMARGGSYASGPAALACAASYPAARSVQDNQFGFRCCSP